MSRIQSAAARLFERAFPSRASTQTWMVLTFVLFVGIAIVAVGLYITFILKSEIQTAFRQTTAREALRIAEIVESRPSTRERISSIREIADFTDLRITVISSDSVLLDIRGDQLLSDGLVRTRAEMNFSDGESIRFADRLNAGIRTYFTAVKRPGTGLIVRTGQPESPLLALVRRMQITLVVAMVMALLLAVIGSWIAAGQVTQPLTAIRNSARSISEGDLKEEIIVDSRASEFQDLAESLNHMSDAFKEKIGELQRMARLQNEFIGNVSHEVRNPIFSVGGYLEALASSTLTVQQRRFYAEKGLSNLERLNNLFSDLIEIARLEYREDLIKPVVFDLRDLSLDVHEFLIGKADHKGIELMMENTPVEVYADRSRIRQVLINLLDNAIAYSDKGTVRLRFRRHMDKVRIEVVDNGRGIPEDHLERIFQRFHRVDPDRSRKRGGTGLGLSIVKQILHAHGEQINVESTVGRGTRFWFELPFSSSANGVART